jgi:hypothetical protein
MKTKNNQSHSNRRSIQHAGLFLSALFVLSTAKAKNQCSDFFKDQFKLNIQFSKEITAVDKDAQMNWSASGNFMSFSKSRANFVTEVESGQTVNLGSDRALFSKEGNSFYLHAKEFGQIYLYRHRDLKPLEINTKLQHISDLRQDKLIGTKDKQDGFFVEDTKTGKIMAHYKDMTVVIKEADPEYLIGVKYPSVFQTTEQTGHIDVVILKSLETGLEVGSQILFHSIDENFRGDFIKIQLTADKNSTAVVRKKDGTLIHTSAEVVKAYEMQDKEKHFVVQMKTELSIYKGETLVKKMSISPERDLHFMGFSNQLSAFVGFDRSISRLVYLTRFQNGFVDVALGPKLIDAHAEAGMELLNSGALVYMSIQGVARVVNLGNMQSMLARPETLLGLSPNKKNIITFNSKTNKWNLFEIKDE